MTTMVTPPPASSTRRWTLVLLAALAALNHLDRQLMSILLEPVRAEFQLTDIKLGLLSGIAFAALFSILSIPAAVWAVSHNRRNLIVAAALLWGSMTALCGLAQSFVQLVLARLGVGVGEAGGMPASQAMVSDLYASGERAAAQATLSAGVNIGVFLAFLIGGYVGQRYGWRTAFVGAGLLTVAMAIAVRFGVGEPGRTAAPPAIAPAAPGSVVLATLRTMWRDPVLRHVTLGAMLTSVVGSGALVWAPSYLVRSHGLGIAAIGLYLAIIVGIGGGLGTWGGGYLSDRLRRRDVRWSLWIVAVAFVVTKPLSVGFYLTDNTALAMALFVLPAMIGATFLGPSVAVLHDRVEPRVRPVASALLSLIMTLVGLGVGPLLVGMMSQWVFAAQGEDSLRYALVVLQIMGFWGAAHFYIAGRRLRG